LPILLQRNIYSSSGKHTEGIPLEYPLICIVTGYRLDNQEFGVSVPVGSIILTSAYRPDWLWCTPSLLSNDYQGLFYPEVKWEVREADHSPPTNTKIKKTWICKYIPPYVFMV
jgi:hypothetical protein